MTLSGVSLKFGGRGRRTDDGKQQDGEGPQAPRPGRPGRPGQRWVVATAAGAAAVIAIGVTVIATSGGTKANTTASALAGNSKKHTTTSTTTVHHKPVVLTIAFRSSSPENGATGVNGTDPITVTYSAKLAAATKLPTLSPSIAGSWQVSGDKATFTPETGYQPGTYVKVRIPANGTAKAKTVAFTTGEYSTLRLQQLLAQLGYLPVTWSPSDSAGDVSATDSGAQLSAAYDPPSGSFTFDHGYPRALTNQWSAGTDNMIVQGAIRTFEYDQGLSMDGIAGPSVWSHLLRAVATGQRNEHGYTYVWVTQAGTEHLVLYHNGKVTVTTDVNTGIAGRGTQDGTFPVYLRYNVTIMQGTNPDGSKYKDTVYYVSYFNGSDAVHYFPRYGYGYYQSLGCVELPESPAIKAYNLMTYGTLVTVTGPEA